MISAGVLERLTVQIVADLDGIADARAEMSGALKGMQRDVQSVADRMSDAAGKLALTGAGLSAAITAPLAAFATQSLEAANQSEAALAQVQSALESMGEGAGRSIEQLSELAAALQATSTFDDDDILGKVTANLLTFGNVSGDVFDRAQQAAVNLSARLGQDLQSSAIQLGKALNDPVAGVTALARVGVSFTEQQRDQIKAMVEAGDVASAQGLILRELEKQYGGAAQAARDATPGADTIDAYREFQETVGALVREALPPLTALLTDVLNGFNNLDPGMQKVVVTGAALAAALGPVALGVSAVMGAVAAAMPVITGMATFMASTLIPTVIATAPIWAPIALGVAAVGAAIAAVIKFWPEISAFCRNMADAFVRAVDTIRNVAGDMIQAGRDIVDGLVRGITGRIGQAVATVRGLGATVKETFKDALGIQSPSRVFMEYGNHIARGLALGIQQGAPDATAAVAELADSVAKAANDNVQARDGFARVFSDGVIAAFNGEGGDFLKGWFRSMLDNVFRNAMANIGNSLFNLIGSKSEGGGLFGTLAKGALSLFGGGKLPGFQTGGSFKVGGVGGPDSKIVSFRATPGEMVDIRKPGQSGGDGGRTVNIYADGYITQEVLRQMIGEAMVQTGRGTHDATINTIQRRQARAFA